MKQQTLHTQLRAFRARQHGTRARLRRVHAALSRAEMTARRQAQWLTRRLPRVFCSLG
jgi:hypothetical protein